MNNSESNQAMKCHGCNNVLNVDHFLKCNNCKRKFCYECLDVAAGSTKQLSAEQLASLNCPLCQNVTRRKNNDDNTPVRRGRNNQSPSASSYITTCKEPECDFATKTSAGADFSKQPVTLDSISKLIDLKLSPDSSFMLNLRSALRKDLKDMVTDEVCRAVESVKADFTTTTDFIILEQNDLKSNIADKDNRIRVLETELTKSQNTLSKLQSRLFTVEKISRDLNLEIHEVPESKTENLMELFKKLCECLKVVVSESDVKACRRVAKMDSNSKRPRNILVTLSTQRQRDTLLSALTRFNKSHPDTKLSTTDIGIGGSSSSRIYLSEHLSPEAKELHHAARKFSTDKNYRFVWVRYGQIYVRKDESSPAILIKSHDSFTKLS